MQKFKGPATFVSILVLVMPGSAVAAQIAVPPGNSEADQYFETLPAPSGNRSPDKLKTVGDAVREGRLSASTANSLEEQGKAGRAVALFVAQTGPDSNDGRSMRTGVAVADVPAEQGLGALFPFLLLVTAVAAGAFVVTRWRQSTGSR